MRRSSAVVSFERLMAEMADEIEASSGPALARKDEGELLWAPMTPEPGRGILLAGGRLVSPQQLAAESLADELFYGGQAGGGKTDLLLGVALTEHKSSIIFRREFTQFKGAEGMIERSRQIIGLRGRLTEGRVWRDLPGGRALEFGAVATDADRLKYQGRPHDLKCVGRGTLVWMADGSARPIESLRVGDCVQTLEGPQLVERIMSFEKPSVRLDVMIDGDVVWSQIQESDHRLLTEPGEWVSHDTLTADRLCQRAASSPTSRLVDGISSGSTSRLCEVLSRGLEAARRLVAPLQGYVRDLSDHRSGPDSFAVVGVSGQGTYSEASARKRRALRQRALSSDLQAPRRLRSLLSEPASVLSGVTRVVEDGLESASREGSQDRCSTDSRQRDARPLPWPSVVLSCLPLPVGVAERIPTRSALDALARTRRRSRSRSQFVHPYTSERRRTESGLVGVSAQSVAVGPRQLFDLTVSSCRHYITGPGIVNQNCFDELPEFPEAAYRFLIGWLRTTRRGQRTRVIGTGNPPMTSEGQWVIRYWGPWLDPSHPNPAKDGELRWYATVSGEDVERPDSTPFWVDGERGMPGQMVQPRSRTFIRASVEDNPHYMRTGYVDVLNSLPEPLRSQLRFGNFQATVVDHPWQVIPMAWIVAAQSRWRPDGNAGQTLSAAGNDPSRGGKDEFVTALRYGPWVAPLDVHAASEAPDGPAGAALVWAAIGGRRDVPVQIDIIGTAGASVYDHAVGLSLMAIPLNGSEKSDATDRSGKLKFVNQRAEWHWKMRELLDPNPPDGIPMNIALPPDPQMRSDLSAPRWRPTPRGVQIEEKDEIKKRLGRSPDRGEAVMYACVTAANPKSNVYSSVTWR